MKKKTLICLIVVVMMSLMLTGCMTANEVTMQFDTHDGTPIESVKYRVGAVVSKPENPIREGYVFDGWYADAEYTQPYIFSVMGDKDIILHAKWIQEVFRITLNGNGGIGTDLQTYDGKSDVTLPTDWVRADYRFAGWYADADFSGNVVSTIPKGSTGDKTFYAKWMPKEEEAYIVTLNGNGGTGTKIASYKHGVGVTLPNDWTREGYTFGGWYESRDCLGESVTEISSTANGDKVFYAKWNANPYTITFDSNGGTPVKVLTIPCGDDIVFDNSHEPTLINKVFGGWYLDASLETKFELAKMPAHNITLYAKWLDGYTVTYISNGEVVQSLDIQDKTIDLIDPLTTSFNMPDYFFDGWYLDTGYTNKCSSPLTLSGETKLFAKWTHRSFVPYMDRFRGGGTESKPIKINNDRELIALVDYAMFTGKEQTFFTLTYTKNNVESNDKISKAMGEWSTNNLVGKVSYGTAKDNSYAEIDIPLENKRDHYNSVPGKKPVAKMLNALAPIPPKTRTADFDAFEYKNYADTLNVETSNQLFYALQYGIKPIVKSGSSAERMLNMAKSVLRDICDDTMTDFEKLYAIFCWINQNVTYDNVAAHRAETEASFVANEYKAWHLEGVFEDKFAVCDGIAKAVTVLARIEGIPCLRATGIGHAWNKVYIDLDKNGVKEWFNLDATWGNGSIGDGKAQHQYDADHIIGEAIDSEQFLFHDDYIISEKKRVSDNHQDIKATTIAVDLFKDLKFTAGGQEYDLVIDKAELPVLAKYVHDYANDNKVTKGTYIVVQVKQNVVAGTENFVTKFSDAMAKENAKHIGDIDLRDFTYSGGTQYTARIFIKV